MHPNTERLNTMIDRFDAGDIEGYFEAFRDDVVVHIAGRSPIAGTVKGKRDAMEHLGRFDERAGESTFDRHAVLADDHHGVLLFSFEMRKGGASLEGTETMVVHFDGDLISEVWITFDDLNAFDRYMAG